MTPRLEYERPYLYPKQYAAIFDQRRYSLIEASTKAGKTTGCVVWLIEQAMRGRAGDNFWWVAPSYTQSQIAFKWVEKALPRDMFQSLGGKTVTLMNGAIISFKTADTPDLLYGQDVYAVVVDEASRMKEEAWEAIRSTLTKTRGPARIIGNVRGRKNWFYRFARRAEQGMEEAGYHKITATDAIEAGVLDQREVEDARVASGMRPEVFRELYFAEAADDQGNPFGVEAIRRCIKLMPLKPKPIVWGWDLAKHVDWTVGIALDTNAQVCAFHRWQHRPWEWTIPEIIRLSGSKPTLVDSTGVGDSIIERLQSAPMSEFEGYKFTEVSKQKLMEGLAVAIQSGQVAYPDGPIVLELEAFEYVVQRTGVRYSAPEGLHDDCVCALALAVMHYSHHKATADYASLAWVR